MNHTRFTKILKSLNSAVICAADCVGHDGNEILHLLFNVRLNRTFHSHLRFFIDCFSKSGPKFLHAPSHPVLITTENQI